MHKRIATLFLILAALQLGLTAVGAYSSNLQAYYPMNHTSGAVVDYSGNGNDGSISGSVTRGVSICNTGHACSTPSSGGYIEIPDSSAVDLSGDFTISLWVKPGESGNVDYLGSQNNPAAGCNQLHKTYPEAPSGNYYIDPDGGGGVSPFQVYCEMSENGGGWIKLEMISDSGNDHMYITASDSDSPLYNSRCSSGGSGTNYNQYRWLNDGDEGNPEQTYGENTWYDYYPNYENPDTGTTYSQSQLDSIRDQVNELSDTTRQVSTSCDDDNDGNWNGHEHWIYDRSDNSKDMTGFDTGNEENAHVIRHTTSSSTFEAGASSGYGNDNLPSNGEYLIPYRVRLGEGDGSAFGGFTIWSYEKPYALVKDTGDNAVSSPAKGIMKPGAYLLAVRKDRLFFAPNGLPTAPSRSNYYFSSSELSTGWNHVMISHDDSADTITYYVNGDEFAQDSFTGSFNNNGNPLRIGDMDMDLSDLRFYNTALTPSDFAQEYSNMRTDGDQVNGLRANMINQTGEVVRDADVWLEKAGSDQLVCPNSNYNKTDHNGNVLFPPLDQTKIYDLFFQSSNYQNQFIFRNIRVPDLVEAGYNQNFVPESTMSNSLKFSAGHVLPAQTLITRPFSDFDVVNVSVEKTLDSSYRMVSDVLVRKYNVDFEGSWQDWSNRKVVDIQEIYNRDWDDSGGEMNNAWGIITFNPEGFQNNDCSDVRLTDKSNTVQDFTVNTCQDDYVEMEFNAPIDALQEKEFYIYYGNSGASDAQTAVQRPSETRQFDFDTGATGTSERYFYQDNNGGTKGFNVTIPQNIDFIERSMTVEGDRIKPKTNNLPVSLDTDYEDFTGMEVEPTRRYLLEGITLQMASTTVDSEFVIRNLTSGNNILVRDIPNNDGGEYFFNYTNQSVQRAGENLVFRPGHKFLMFVRYGEARRASSTETQSPMFNLTDTVFHTQFFSLNSDGTGGTEGDYPVLVSQIDTIDPEYPTNVTITHENTGQQVYNGPDQLNDQQTVDLTSYLDSVDWREGDPLDDPKLHEFTVESDTDGNLSMTFDTRVEFEHPVTTVSKTASGCSVNPETQTYFHIDRSDCSYLDRVNVSQGQWFRLDYRFRTPGPNDFDAPGDTNSYNISDTMVRFDILQETEEFTTG